MTITRSDVRHAAARIAPFVRRTPVVVLAGSGLGLPHDVVVKLEQLQHSGSFKARGAFNTLLSADVPATGVIAASGGNHGAAVAYAAQRLGHRATIFVPAAAPEAKLARIRRYGADVVAVGRDYAEAYRASAEEESRTGALRVHAYDQPEVVAGQGTVAAELSEQAPDLDTVLIAVGGGGLIAGCASWYTDSLRVVGVEPERAPTLHAARAAGHPVDVEVGGLAADALGARRLGAIAAEVADRYVDEAVLVPDEAIREAQRLLWEELRVLAEPGGATALAALLSGAHVAAAGDRVGVVVCGANLDPASWSVLPEAGV
ncbi:threonine/serine dehydratase [Modestobacter sp. VKM Ac-2983]|uniref:threonine/serine dehydratase n=1 Tax=Modestobacter sp. VKM Ac-2983 TaxID=3004137 RepID=UPI0022AB85BD|nr:threonine/serine dehydratase [Modestobacter sp. VKM Ac-2983]MCZ2804931.1 threonine/serine dehydratase [Modestobacter sp. VKM Ac-2983]